TALAVFAARCQPMVLVSQAESGNGEGRLSIPSGQQVEGGQHKRQMSFQIWPGALAQSFEATDALHHGQHRLDEPTRVPLAAGADLEVGRVGLAVPAALRAVVEVA